MNAARKNVRGTTPLKKTGKHFHNKPSGALEREYPRGKHSYQGNFGKFLTCLDDADRNFRMAVELLETGESDRAIERLFNAVTSWVERLRILVTAPPESCREPASKLVRERLTFPINFAGLTTYAKPAFTWLEELGFQRDCFYGIPREEGSAHKELFRQFVFHILFRLAVLRAELEWRKPAGAFEERVAKLPRNPDPSWRECFQAAPTAFYGKEWVLECPDLESFRRSFDGKFVPLHTPKNKRPAKGLRYKSHHMTELKDHARHELKDFAKVLFGAKRGTHNASSPSAKRWCEVT